MADGLKDPTGKLYRREEPKHIRAYEEILQDIEQREVRVSELANELPDRLTYHLLGGSLDDVDSNTVSVDEDLYDDLLGDLETAISRAEHREKPFLSTLSSVSDHMYCRGYESVNPDSNNDIGGLQDDIYEAQYSKNWLTAGGVLGGLGAGLTAMLGLAAAGATVAVPAAGLGLIYGGRKAGIEAWKYFLGRQERLEEAYSAREVERIEEQYGDLVVTIDSPVTCSAVEDSSDQHEDETERDWTQDDIVNSIEELGGELPDRFTDE